MSIIEKYTITTIFYMNGMEITVISDIYPQVYQWTYEVIPAIELTDEMIDIVGMDIRDKIPHVVLDN
jgi:hypothetical protein